LPEAWEYIIFGRKINQINEVSSKCAAGMAIVKRSTCNGWDFWKYKDKSGDLVAIKDLR